MYWGREFQRYRHEGNSFFQKETNGSWATLETFTNSGTDYAQIRASLNSSSAGNYRIKCFVRANGVESDVRYAFATY